MKRHSVVRIFCTKLLTDEDIAIFTGKETCKEAYEYDRPGNLYLNDNFGLAVSLATGVAMGTTKRVFVFTGEGDLTRELASGLQMAVSKCKNLFMVVLNNKSYAVSSPNLPNIFGTMTSSKSMIASFGLFLHDYTVYFKTGNHKSLFSFFYTIKGPTAIFVDVDPGNKKKLPDIDMEPEVMASRIMITIQSIKETSDLENKKIPVLELNKPVEFGGV